MADARIILVSVLLEEPITPRSEAVLKELPKPYSETGENERFALPIGNDALLPGSKSILISAEAGEARKRLTNSCAVKLARPRSIVTARPATLIEPNEIRAQALDRDYRVFLRMQDHRRELAAIA